MNNRRGHSFSLMSHSLNLLQMYLIASMYTALRSETERQFTNCNLKKQDKNVNLIFHAICKVRKTFPFLADEVPVAKYELWEPVHFDNAAVISTRPCGMLSEREARSLKAANKWTRFSCIKHSRHWWMAPQMSTENLMDLWSYKCLYKLMHVIIFSIQSLLLGILLQCH